MHARRNSYAPPPVAPTSFRGASDDSSAQVDSYEEDDAATVIWQGGRSALPSRMESYAPPSQRWNETPMAFEPARVPPPMPSIAPMEMDLAAAGPAQTSDVLSWLPLASAACVGVAIAGLLFAVALTSFRGREATTSNASAGASIANAMPVTAHPVATPLMPVIRPTVSEPVAAQIAQPDAPSDEVVAPPAPAVTAPAARTSAPVVVAPVAPATTAAAPIAPKAAAPVARNDRNERTERNDRNDRAVVAPAEAPKKSAAPRVDDEAASAQKMLEEAQRETSGAL